MIGESGLAASYARWLVLWRIHYGDYLAKYGRERTAGINLVDAGLFSLNVFAVIARVMTKALAFCTNDLLFVEERCD